MQTPYLLIKSKRNNLNTNQELKNRIQKMNTVGDVTFIAYPPDIENEIDRFNQRLYIRDNSFFYEDGFMVRYPESYKVSVENKLSYFGLESHELDGAYSRISFNNGVVTVDGSATYLQTLFSYESNDCVLISNNIDLIHEFLTDNNISLTINEEFFASHLCNYSLAFYAFMGTPYNEIEVRDSVETITISNKLNVEIKNKMPLQAYNSMSREERIDLLHKRLTHCLDQYSDYLSLSVLGHNVTGGRDSRASLALFAQNQREKLLIVTGGHNYTPDKLISKLISERFSIESEKKDPSHLPHRFDYRNVMNTASLMEVLIPMFRKIQVVTKFDPNRFVASGYLGNVLTFSGSERNIFMRDNRMKIDNGYQDKLTYRFDEKVESLRSVYGDNCYAMFNIMYNTTNKVASVCRRLKMNTFCVFENDLFQLMYFLEDSNKRKNSSLHYELMKKSNHEMLTRIPFEGNKSFGMESDTFELQTFKEAGNPGLYKKYLNNHLSSVVSHIKKNKAELPFITDKFIEKVEDYIGKELPVLLVNKIYACMGALEFKGIEYGLENSEERSSAEIYSMEFFKNMYVDNQIYCSGLSGMVYQKMLSFKTFIEMQDNEVLRVSVTDKISGNKLKVNTSKVNDGYITELCIPEDGEYLVQLSRYFRGKKEINHFYKTKFVAKNVERNSLSVKEANEKEKIHHDRNINLLVGS